MVINRIDGRYYASESDFPDYGSWTLVSTDGNIRTLGGDDDASKLPTNLPPTSKAMGTDGTLHVWTGSEWARIGG